KLIDLAPDVRGHRPLVAVAGDHDEPAGFGRRVAEVSLAHALVERAVVPVEAVPAGRAGARAETRERNRDGTVEENRALGANGVPPGSRVRRTPRPRVPMLSARRAACTDFPAASPPSNERKVPVTDISGRVGTARCRCYASSDSPARRARAGACARTRSAESARSRRTARRRPARSRRAPP